MLTLAPRRVAGLLGLAIATLTALSTLGQAAKFGLGYDHLKGFVPLFYLSDEGNVPTWYSAATLLLCSLLLALIATVKRKENDPDTRRWQLLALLFLYLSVDEAACLHELTVKPLQAVLRIQGGMLFYAWVIPGATLVAAVGLFYLQFLRRLPAKTRNLFVLAAALFVGGALELELPEGWYAARHGRDNVVLAAIATAQEVLEMTGVAVFLYALLDYLATHVRTVQVRFADKVVEPAFKAEASPERPEGQERPRKRRAVAAVGS